MMKNGKIVKKLILIDQKKRPDAWTQRRKPQLFKKYGFWKNLKIPHKITFFDQIRKNGNFWRYFLIFSEIVLGKDLGVFALGSVHQDASFELSKSITQKYYHFFTMRGDLYD